MRKEIVLLLVIFVLAVSLRFYKLSTIPLGFYVDEAAIGYNSYSILQTGKDEYGKSFPVYFRSFGDYKMPLYIYLSAIPIKFFGLNIFSVRFLSALSGSLTILVVYLLSRNLFPDEKKLAFIIALLFAILPWTVFLSRMALEMQLSFFLLLLAILFHQKALQKFWLKWWLLAAVFYALSAYAYHTEKFIAPLIFIFWSLLNFQKSRKKEKLGWWKNFISATLVLFVLLWPQIKLSFSSGANARIKSLSYFQEKQNIPYKNMPLAGLRKWGAMYTSYFSPRNLFFDPDSDQQRSLLGLSVFYPWMVVPFLIGLFSFTKERLHGKKLIILLLLISPLPASLTGDPFSSFRAFPLVFPFGVLISLGIVSIMSKLKKILIFATGGVILCLSLGFLYRSLYILLPNERFLAWKYGYEKLYSEINKGEYSKILIDDPIGTSYAQILFFGRFDPLKLQKERKIDLTNYYQLTSWEKQQFWDRYEIRSIYWKGDVYQKQLIVATPIAISENQAKEHFFSKAFAIIGPDGKTIFNGYLTNPDLKRHDDERKIKLIKNESRNF